LSVYLWSVVGRQHFSNREGTRMISAYVCSTDSNISTTCLNRTGRRGEIICLATQLEHGIVHGHVASCLCRFLLHADHTTQCTRVEWLRGQFCGPCYTEVWSIVSYVRQLSDSLNWRRRGRDPYTSWNCWLEGVLYCSLRKHTVAGNSRLHNITIVRNHFLRTDSSIKFLHISHSDARHDVTHHPAY
jgi:hypothetical protein